MDALCQPCVGSKPSSDGILASGQLSWPCPKCGDEVDVTSKASQPGLMTNAPHKDCYNIWKCVRTNQEKSKEGKALMKKLSNMTVEQFQAWFKEQRATGTLKGKKRVFDSCSVSTQEVHKTGRNRARQVLCEPFSQWWRPYQASGMKIEEAKLLFKKYCEDPDMDKEWDHKTQQWCI